MNSANNDSLAVVEPKVLKEGSNPILAILGEKNV
jgi:hypothetical protein